MAGNKRSPASPTSSLQQAIERVKRLHQANHDHWMPMEAAATAWKFSPKSSGFLQAIATLIQFGLLLEKGSKDEREFKLSDTALDIVTYPEDSDEWQRAVQLAALSPQIYQEMWTKFEGRLPPDDASMRVYLLRQREGGTFRQEQADETIRLFRETISFSKPDDSAIICEEEPQATTTTTPAPQVPDMGHLARNLFSHYQTPKPKPPSQPPGKQAIVFGTPAVEKKTIPITLPTLRVAMLEVPYPLSDLEYTTLVNSLTSFKDALMGTGVATPPERTRVIDLKPNE